MAIYAIGLLADDDTGEASRARRALNELAEASGGATMYPATVDGVQSAAVDLAREIRSQYMLSYQPLNQAQDSSFRRIRVELTPSAKRRHADAILKAREGYYATAQQ